MTERYEVISDEVWSKIWFLLPGSGLTCGKKAENNRLFLNAVFWIMRTGSPWRDLPQYFGNWNTQYKRYRRWCVNGTFSKLYRSLVESPEFGFLCIDGSIVKLHQHATCGQKGGIGRSR
jgi:transposase